MVQKTIMDISLVKVFSELAYTEDLPVHIHTGKKRSVVDVLLEYAPEDEETIKDAIEKATAIATGIVT